MRKFPFWVISIDNADNEVKLFLDDIRKDEDVINSADYHKTIEKGHGRIEIRECVISYETGWLTKKSEWAGLCGIGAIYCNIEKNGQVSTQAHYFIFSCKNMTAEKIMYYKRNHWSIENSLHWILDMAFREDESRARKDNSAENFNVIRHVCYNILKSDTSFKGSITDKQFRCLLDSNYLDKIVALWINS